jgi:hypothetical protein
MGRSFDAAGQNRCRADVPVVKIVRWLAFLAVAAFFFALALRGDVYVATSPPSFGWHVALRKAYSIGAFAIVGALFRWASGERPGFTALIVAVYSGGIEAGQRITDGHESLAWEAFDVACGAVGGWLGALATAWGRAK